VRHDLVEDDVPRLAGPCDFVEVQGLIVRLVAKADEMAQDSFLLRSQRQALFLADDGFPGQKIVPFQHGDEALDRLLQVPGFIEGTELEEIVGWDVRVEFPSYWGWLHCLSFFLCP
jgi:hypothetical protein